MTGKWKICLVLLAGATVAQALTVGPLTTTTPIPSTKTDWSNTLAFPQFDPALGILQSVELKISGAFNSVLTITNTASSPSSGWAKAEVILHVQDAGNNLNDPVLDLLTNPQYDFALDPGQSITTGSLSKSGNSADVYTNPVILAEFTGTGSINLTASTQTYAVLSYTGGNTEATQSTYASATGTVTYTYITPEPATLAFLSLGLVGLLRRR